MYVLRGPPDTPYCAGSLGGTIKFITKQPDAKRYSGSAYPELSITSHGSTNDVAQAVLIAPLNVRHASLNRIPQ